MKKSSIFQHTVSSDNDDKFVSDNKHNFHLFIVCDTAKVNICYGIIQSVHMEYLIVMIYSLKSTMLISVYKEWSVIPQKEKGKAW